jgi:hypothetical protein
MRGVNPGLQKEANCRFHQENISFSSMHYFNFPLPGEDP